jgi:hypothetical protein
MPVLLFDAGRGFHLDGLAGVRWMDLLMSNNSDTLQVKRSILYSLGADTPTPHHFRPFGVGALRYCS